MLRVERNKIVDGDGNEVMLRGVNIGGWMNMEHFIDGFPGAEHDLRIFARQELGEQRGERLFDSLLDHFFTEADVAYLASAGATVVRLPLNYRHFEDDARPGEFLPKGFERLDKALEWCGKHNIYAILDLHSVQGFQSPDWHCDNSSRRSQLWTDGGFQDRFVALWEEMAHRYNGNPVVAGYDVMNEPVTNSERGTLPRIYEPIWDRLNTLYRRVVAAIRAIDSQHIVFLEGDYYSERFDGMEAPFADNLVYSSHHYPHVGDSYEPYPGPVKRRFEPITEDWNKSVLHEDFFNSEGYQFAVRHDVPLWVSEFGPVYRDPKEYPWRGAVLNDQLEIFQELNAHWTLWTYKDVGVQGLVQLDPASDLLRLTTVPREKTVPIFPRGKEGESELVKAAIRELADRIYEHLGVDTINREANRVLLEYSVVENYVNNLVQPLFVNVFRDKSETEIDRIMEAFDFNRCHKTHVAEILTPFLPRAQSVRS